MTAPLGPLTSDVRGAEDPAETSASLASGEEAVVVASETAAPPGSLKALVVRGSVITMAGFGAAQCLRLVSSIILTRLLNREAYGLYRLANVFLEGLAYFTAIGSGPAVIRDPRGDEPAFLNTAWTMQALRGVGLWLAACALAAPYAWFYRQPILWLLIPVVGLTVLLDGFDSVAVHWCFRHMQLFRVTALEFLRQLTALLVTISWAMMSPTVWAFPAGAIMGCIVVLALSHMALPGPKSRFHWDREAARRNTISANGSLPAAFWNSWPGRWTSCFSHTSSTLEGSASTAWRLISRIRWRRSTCGCRGRSCIPSIPRRFANAPGI